MRNFAETTFPFLWLSKTFNVPYGDVVNAAAFRISQLEETPMKAASLEAVENIMVRLPHEHRRHFYYYVDSALARIGKWP
jgi:hypothetical protein